MLTKKNQWLLHLIGSIVFLLIPILNTEQRDGNGIFTFSGLAMQDMLRYILLLGFFYLNYFLLIPALYFGKQYILYFVIVIGCMLLVAFLPQLVRPIGMPGPMGPPPQGMMPPPGPGGERNFFFSRIDHNLFLFVAVAFFSLLIRVNNRWKRTEKEKLDTELSYLKAQINPHFLFNTLNSIYSLSIQKSDSTPEAVQKLSAMMRYVLTEAANDTVPLKKELDYIRNYIDLQKLRFGDEVKLNYSIWGKEEGKRIAPLILISFIENAFKYGLNAAEDTNIKIVINLYESRLEMLVINNKVTVQVSTEARNGIGISNTRNRLGLLYPSAHELKITEDEHQFSVNLSIDF
ncbi:sensor histidine kinase [Ferruginibacter sp. HRS2-29]|uniref:sensor histidine kinase n=1 Tax=Ferruginibacter sp. HRS2-29 TaxID=2487334 RepID=UPI0020CFA9E7|nr:histidine kinase [Ferruginibacter sp. HRS2-29]MCP9751901.1 sensor histidine kinase [Ferruginibacter sp. HRS2-29]